MRSVEGCRRNRAVRHRVPLGPERWEEHDVTNGLHVGQHHGKAINADTKAHSWRKSIFEGA